MNLEFEDSLVYRVSSKMARDRDTCLQGGEKALIMS